MKRNINLNSTMIIMITILCLGVSLNAAPSVRGKIEGIVIDDQAAPIKGVEVEVVSMKMASRRYNLKSNAEGKFTQVGLWPDFYRVTAKKEGYIQASIEIRIRIDETRKLQITLHKAEQVIQNQLSEADKHFVQGNKYLEQNQYEEAAREFERATELGKTQWAYFFNLGLAHKKAGKAQESIQAFTKAVELNPESFSCNKELGEALAKAKNFTAAKGYYAKAIELNDEDPDTNYNYGVVMMSEGDPDTALAAFLRVVQVKEDYADAYYQMGTLYVGQNNQEEAIKNLEKFLELAPDHPQASVAKQLLEYLKKQPARQRRSGSGQTGFGPLKDIKIPHSVHCFQTVKIHDLESACE